MRDWIPSGEMSFLAGDSEMARRIRAFDWSTHPFGPLGEWPQSLRSALSICLHSAFPTAIYWGSELRLLYNDAWAPIPGPRHPEALGAPAREVWSDIWHVIGPQFDRLFATGDGIAVENQMLPMTRFGAPEETYWNYSFTAIRGEDGEIAGVFNSGSETTESVRTERQMRFLLDYGEALRTASSPEEGRSLSLSMLGSHLGVHRVGIAELQDDEEVVSISEEWSAQGVAPLEQRVRLSEFGAIVADGLQAGRTITSNDVATDERFDAAARESFREHDIAAFVALPWRVRRKLAGVVYLHTKQPRAWSTFDITTVEALLERTRAWIDAERAAEREKIVAREIDHRARNALTVAQSVVRLTRADGIAEFREKVENRLAALGRANGLLAERHWHSLDLGAMLRHELEAYTAGGGIPVDLKGPTVSLPAEMAQPLALVLHELTTNAAKHGALAASDGKLEISWRVDAPSTLWLDWRETVPPAEKAADGQERQGFGTILISRMVEAQLGGRFDSRLQKEGLSASISIPLDGSAVDEPAEGRREA